MGVDWGIIATYTSWIACGVAVNLALIGAVAIPPQERQSRIITALALFALQYTLLMVYYSIPSFQFDRPAAAKLIPGCSGFLLVYIGILLHRQADEEGRSKTEDPVAPLDILAFICLAVITASATIAAFPIHPSKEYDKISRIVCDWFSLGTHVLGFLKTGQALSLLYNGDPQQKRYSNIIWFILLFYTIFELLDTAHYTYTAVRENPTAMITELKFAFATTKFIFTLCFVAMIRCRPIKSRNASLPWMRTFGEDIKRGFSWMFGKSQHSILGGQYDANTGQITDGEYNSDEVNPTHKELGNMTHEESETSVLPGKIFIGHGRSSVWRDLKDYLTERLKLSYEEFNREATAGLSTKERLEEMLKVSSFAFLIMTAEDEHSNTTMHARENVIHEIGLFQGKLGSRRAIILLEEGCAEFTNIVGISQLRFPKGDINHIKDDIRKVLEREGLLQ